MKKLMIAAAAVSAAAGAFASVDCASCGNNPDKLDCNAAFANVTFKLQTLAPKKVTCGGCEGWCMEQGNRTVEGILWSCCTCDDDYPWQISLWEKKGSVEYTDSLVYGPRTAGSKSCSYTATQTVYAKGTISDKSDFEYDTEDAALQAAYAKYGKDTYNIKSSQDDEWTCKWFSKEFTTNLLEKVYTGVIVTNTTPVCKTKEAAESLWYQPDTPSAKVKEGKKYMYEDYEQDPNGASNSGLWAWNYKKVYNNDTFTYTSDVKSSESAAKAEVTLAKITAKFDAGAIVTLVGEPTVREFACEETADSPCSWWATDWDDMGKWFRYSKNADKVEAFMAYDNNGFEVYAAGFGTWDAVRGTPKAINGYAVGKIDPTAVCGDMGKLLEVCGTFKCSDNCWADEQLDAEKDNTFFKGTWAVKYNAGLLKKDMKNIVPNFVYSTRTVTCAY